MKKRKFLSLLLAAIMLLSLMPIGAGATGAGEFTGDGTPEKPYDIYLMQHLTEFMQIVNGTHPTIAQNRSACAELHADINLNDDRNILNENGELNGTPSNEWSPIAPDFFESYTGTFNGNGHTIKGLYINSGDVENAAYGLFAHIGKGAVIKNVNVKDAFVKNNAATFTLDKPIAQYATAILVGDNLDGTIENCSVEGTVYAARVAGGLVGYAETVSEGTIKNSHAKVRVSGEAVTGGFAGYLNNISVENCYSESTVIGKERVGGFVGDSSANIKNCYSKSSVTGVSQVGGFSGQFFNNCTIKNSYTVSTVNAVKDTDETPLSTERIGGFVGYKHNGVIVDSYCATSIAAPSDITITSIGAFAGENKTGATNCYYNSELYSGESVGLATSDNCIVSIYKKNTAQFASGEVAYKLNGNQSTIIFGQKIGTDAYPVFYNNSNKVSVTSGCPDYNNEGNTAEKEHVMGSNGMFTVCGLPEMEEPQTDEDGVYQIATKENLYWFMNHVAMGNDTADAKLTADIEANSGVITADGTLASDTSKFIPWTPLGDEDLPYDGNFDGNGHKISGIYANMPDSDFVGFFGKTSARSIKNLGIENSYFSGNEYVGAIAGSADSAIFENCFTTGIVKGKVCGGMAGSATGFVNCYTLVNMDCVTDKSNAFSSSASTLALNSYCINSMAQGTIKTAEQFASGEVAYLLARGHTVYGETYDGSIWGQDLSEDSFPVFGGKKVYATTGCITYTNTENPGKKEHVIGSNEICTVCGVPEMEEPEFENGAYQITNAKELFWFNALTTGKLSDIPQDLSANAVLKNDIVLNEKLLNKDNTLAKTESAIKPWTPIGEYTDDLSKGYKGVFDGAGHTIKGLYVKSPDAAVGMFAFVCMDLNSSGGKSASADQIATIKNLNIEDSYFHATSPGVNYTGSIVGMAVYSIIDNCSNSGYVYGVYSGGIAGLAMEAYVSDSYNTGYVKSEMGYAAGICVAASYNSAVAGCYNTGKLSAPNGAAGIVATADNSTVAYCCCYLDTCAEEGTTLIGNNSDLILKLTADEFASGKAAYCLQTAEELNTYLAADICGTWGQTLTGKDADDFPVITEDSAKRVYGIQFIDAEDNVLDLKFANASGLTATPAPKTLGTDWFFDDIKFTAKIPMTDDITVISKPVNYSLTISEDATKVNVYADKAGEYKLVLAAYDENGLADYECINVSVATDKTNNEVAVPTSFDIVGAKDVKAFLLDDFDNITPMCEGDLK